MKTSQYCIVTESDGVVEVETFDRSDEGQKEVEKRVRELAKECGGMDIDVEFTWGVPKGEAIVNLSSGCEWDLLLIVS